ncbi:MAG TPA: DNA alkylation repair protein [Rhizobiaceae bacterium]|nr:DNA alkylation repair protein [Rhizobiaceae bacterium]
MRRGMVQESETYLLKEIFNRERLSHIATETAAVSPGFDTKRFMKLATRDLDGLSIMQRMRQVATSLHETLPGGFKKNADILSALAPRVNHSFAAISLSEYIALYGESDFDRSMDALKHLTRFGSSEFAIRHFLVRDLEKALAVMRRWAEDENEHVRRLASEGCRPRLPWSFQIKELLGNPEPAAPILDALKADPAIYVRKSVANHLNDITKDRPDWVLDRLSYWPRDNVHTAWIMKQALRTLIKKGNAGALALVGASGKAEVRVDLFAVTPKKITLGDRIRIDAKITSTSDGPQRLVIDYAVHYVKKKSDAGRKVFKLKEIDLAAGATIDLSISQTVKDFTTRKHAAGDHKIELMINGVVLATSGFDLKI